jgi:hypothetical protein
MVRRDPMDSVYQPVDPVYRKLIQLIWKFVGTLVILQKHP